MKYSGFGKLKEVENKQRRFGSARTYLSVRVYDKNKKALDLLFTDRELKLAAYRASINKEDTLKPKSIWQKFWDWMDK